eukprot:6212504-Pleurochrysis_carterae.AAC.2
MQPCTWCLLCALGIFLTETKTALVRPSSLVLIISTALACHPTTARSKQMVISGPSAKTTSSARTKDPKNLQHLQERSPERSQLQTQSQKRKTCTDIETSVRNEQVRFARQSGTVTAEWCNQGGRQGNPD